jgi:hypothetical protein
MTLMNNENQIWIIRYNTIELYNIDSGLIMFKERKPYLLRFCSCWTYFEGTTIVGYQTK